MILKSEKHFAIAKLTSALSSKLKTTFLHCIVFAHGIRSLLLVSLADSHVEFATVLVFLAGIYFLLINNLTIEHKKIYIYFIGINLICSKCFS